MWDVFITYLLHILGYAIKGFVPFVLKCFLRIRGVRTCGVYDWESGSTVIHSLLALLLSQCNMNSWQSFHKFEQPMLLRNTLTMEKDSVIEK